MSTRTLPDPAALPKEVDAAAASGVHEKPAPLDAPTRVHECCGLPWSPNYTPKAFGACIDRLPRKFRPLAIAIRDAANFDDKPRESAGHCYSGRLWFAEKLGFTIIERPGRGGRGPSRDCPHMRQLWSDFVAYVNDPAHEVGFTIAEAAHYRKGGKGGRSTDHFVVCLTGRADPVSSPLTACGQAASSPLTACGQAELTACGQAGAPPVGRRSYYPGPALAGTRGEDQIDADARGPSGRARREESRAPAARTPCPIDFEPDAGGLALAVELERDAASEAAIMRDHALDKGRTSCDWQAAFCGWLRQGAKFDRERATNADAQRLARGNAAARKADAFRAACAEHQITSVDALAKRLAPARKPPAALVDAVAAFLDVEPAAASSLTGRQRAKCAKALAGGRK